MLGEAETYWLWLLSWNSRSLRDVSFLSLLSIPGGWKALSPLKTTYDLWGSLKDERFYLREKNTFVWYLPILLYEWRFRAREHLCLTRDYVWDDYIMRSLTTSSGEKREDQCGESRNWLEINVPGRTSVLGKLWGGSCPIQECCTWAVWTSLTLFICI